MKRLEHQRLPLHHQSLEAVRYREAARRLPDRAHLLPDSWLVGWHDDRVLDALRCRRYPLH